jgi:hypothetical protein
MPPSPSRSCATFTARGSAHGRAGYSSRREDCPPARRRCLFALFLLAVLSAMLVAPPPGRAADADSPWSVEAKTKFLFHSYTSYEFGNPFPPYQSPLSRLEFPINSVWTGFEVRRRLDRFSIGLEYLTTLSDQETGHFKDSDWADDSAPARLSTFGETKCRLRPSHQLRADLDAQLGDLLRLPDAVELAPVIGFRWQRLSLLAHDGLQNEYDITGTVTDTLVLPGHTISFLQDWYQYFVGARLGYTWAKPPLLHHVKFNSQADWSYVTGNNTDKHLLRGNRVTREDTTGHAWHVLLGVMLGVTEHLDVGVEGEYLNIDTTGKHKWRQDSLALNWSHGVRVWSEQSSLSVKLEYRF